MPARGVTNETHWTERAEALLGPLLHAAAIAGEEMAALVTWINSRQLQDATDILAEGGSARAGESLAGMAQTHYRELSSIWSTTAGVVATYQSERAPGHHQVGQGHQALRRRCLRALDRHHLRGRRVRPPTPGRPLVVGLIDDIRRATYRATAAKELAVPVLLALNEVRKSPPFRGARQLRSIGESRLMPTLRRRPAR